MEFGSKRKQPRSRKATLAKYSTPSSKKHRFEPFSHRIAKLRIDPIRKSAGRAVDEDDVSASNSYFKTALDNWVELNLSEDFTDFSKRLLPLSDSLPQIIHHQDQIVDLLVEYVEKEQTAALEPLLDLVSHFAHDVGLRFEKHFHRIITTIARVASHHPDAEVIEWSFNCLAWLFKYLSRLLVPNLQPLYDIMAPLLGKERQKPFITRFAAEAMSFLLRKAGASYHKSKDPLSNIVAHIFADLTKSSNDAHLELYEQGVMTLFAESIRGVQDNLHSSASAIFGELLKQYLGIEVNETHTQGQSTTTRVLQGVLIATMQHTSCETFKPVEEAILLVCQDSKSGDHIPKLRLRVHLLLILASVKNGAQVSDWESIFQKIAEWMSVLRSDIEGRDSVLIPEILTLLAVAHQQCPLNLAISTSRSFSILLTDPWQGHFLGFCGLHAELGRQRFDDFLLPTFKEFIITCVQDYEQESAACILRLQSVSLANKLNIVFPATWQDTTLNKIKVTVSDVHSLDSHEKQIFLCSAVLEMLREGEGNSDFRKSATTLIEDVWNASSDTLPESTIGPLENFVAGNAFTFAVRHGGFRATDSTWWKHLCEVVPRFESLTPFWTSTLELLRQQPSSFKIEDVGPGATILQTSLLDCLSSASHDLRSIALEVVLEIVRREAQVSSQIFEDALSIENTTPSLETMRSMSLQVRNLASEYKTATEASWRDRVIPAWCFGLLHVKFSQLWTDACNALKDMCDSKQGEEIVCGIAFRWLEGCATPEPAAQARVMAIHPKINHAIADFDSTYLENVLTMSKEMASTTASAEEYLQDQFQKRHSRVPLQTDFNRTQALRLLALVPHVAEKRSKEIVPALLRWALDDDEQQVPESSSESPASASDAPEGFQKWSRKDQKAMLSLFAEFKNPKALYKSEQVYEAVLKLLMHGDVEIQKSALKAIFAWRSTNIKFYEQSLLKFVDSAILREHLAVFFSFGDSDGSLQQEHRAELMPIILRLLYGRVIIRGKRDHSIRKSVFLLLARLNESEQDCFFDLALGPMAHLKLVEDGQFQQTQLLKDICDLRKQHGMLNMIKELLEIMQTTATPFAARLVDPIVYCLLRVARMEEAAKNDEHINPSALKSQRQVALYCLITLFEIKPDFDWQPYMPQIFAQIVEPRIPNFPAENSTAISGLLRLLATWSGYYTNLPYLMKFNHDMPTKIAECLSNSTTKDEVKSFILTDILGAVLDQAEHSLHDQRQSASMLLDTYGSSFLNHLALSLRQQMSKDLLDEIVKTIVRLSRHIEPSNPELLRIAAMLITEPSRRVSRAAKVDLLRIILQLVPHVKEVDALMKQVYPAVCASFTFFADRESRLLLCDILCAVSGHVPWLEEIAQLCKDLNSFTPNRLDEPDFDRRSQAYQIINEGRHLEFTTEQWRPLLSNMTFFVKDTEELLIRLSSSHSIRRCIESAATQTGESRTEFEALLQSVVMVQIERGIKDQPELVRVEYLTVLVHATKHLPHWPVIGGLEKLIDNDDEASILPNILHIQQHRRIKALQRLATECTKGTVSGNALAQLLIPLIERFIFDAGDAAVAGEAVRTIGVLLESIDWSQFRQIVRRYINSIKKNEDHQETTLKLVDGASVALSQAVSRKSDASLQQGLESPPSAEGEPQSIFLSRLAQTVPAKKKIAEAVSKDFLPTLTRFLQDKDDSFVSRRTIAAISTARLLQQLPEAEFAWRFPALLTDICNILRSKEQGSRDMARKTLASICSMIGPSSIGFIIKELQRALQRGFLLHVLSFSVHTILEATVSAFKPGDIDYCATDIVAIIVEDIFGNTSEEKDAAEYVKNKDSKKEIKGRKSFDTMQLLAQTTSLQHQMQLVRPLEALLLENLNNKKVRNIDELLRRIGLGLLQNRAVQDRDILVFCYEIIQDAYNFANGARRSSREPKRNSLVASNYLIKGKVAKAQTSESLATMARVGKIVHFALELLRGVLRKHKELATPENLDGFMPIIGDAIINADEHIKLAAMRLVTAIVTVPLPRIDADAPVYVDEAAKVVEERQGVHDELAQAALKLLSAILKEKKNVPVNDQVVAALLKQMRPELQVISQQGSAFNLLRAIIARKIIVPEMYELIDGEDGVAAILVRDHDRTTRDLARGVYFAFLMDFPQSDRRFSKQIAFLTRNLEYKHAEGRQSVMEILFLLLTKLGDAMAEKVIKEVFWPLVSVMVNDESDDCRQMASQLLQLSFSRAGEEWVDSFLLLFKKLLGNTTKPVHRRTALQSWILYLDAKQEDVKGIDYVLEALRQILTFHGPDVDEDWETIYTALRTMHKICDQRPKMGFGAQSEAVWLFVRRRLSFPQAWVKLEAAKLNGLYLQDFAAASKGSLSSLPLKGSGGLSLGRDEICELLSRHLRLLRVGMSQDLADQTKRNLANLARFLAANDIIWRSKTPSHMDEVNEPEAASEQSEEEPEEDAVASTDQSALSHLLIRLAQVLRKDEVKKSEMVALAMRHHESLIPRNAALDMLTTLCANFSVPQITHALETILLPLAQITHPANLTPFAANPAYKDAHQRLIENAESLMSALQNKLGTTGYVEALQRVRAQVRRRRDDRRRKRRIEVVVAPEKFEQMKRRKRENEKTRKKEKGQLMRGLRRGW